MNTLPNEFIDEKVVPRSLMKDGVNYSVHYDSIDLDIEGHLWIRRNQKFTVELEDWEEENNIVYIKRRAVDGHLTITIPKTFSRRKKWPKEDSVDPNKYIMVGEIVVE